MLGNLDSEDEEDHRTNSPLSTRDTPFIQCQSDQSYCDGGEKPIVLRHMYRQRLFGDILTTQASLNLCLNAILVTHSMIFDEFLPIFMFSQRETFTTAITRASGSNFPGGLGIKSSEIAIYFLVYGIFAAVVQLTVFPPTVNRFGPLKCLKICSGVFPLVYALVPLTLLLDPDSAILKVAILGIMLAKSFLAAFSFPCSMILLSNSISSSRHLSTLNGITTCISGLTRGIGALIFGTLFTLGLRRSCMIIPWWMLAIFTLFSVVPSFWLEDMETIPTE